MMTPSETARGATSEGASQPVTTIVPAEAASSGNGQPPPQQLGKEQPGPPRSEFEATHQQEIDPHVKKIMNNTVGRLAQGAPAVQMQTLRSYIKEQRRSASDCFQFPFMIGYFVMFAVMVLLHEDITNVSQVERNFRNMLEGTTFEGTIPNITANGAAAGQFVSGHKSMEDIDVIVDIWTYLHDAMIPLFIPNLDGVSARDLNRVLRYNQIIGGVQLQQIRREKVQCVDAYPNLGPKSADTDTNPLLVGFACYPYDQYSSKCFGPGASGGNAPEGFCPDNETQSATLRLLSEHDTTGWLRQGLKNDAKARGRRLQSPHHADKVQGRESDSLAGYNDAPGLYTVTLHEHEGLEKAKEKMEYLKASDWLDVATAWFGFKMFVLNPDLGVYTHVIVNVWFPPSGELIPAVKMSSTLADPYQYKSVIASDIIFGVFWLHLMIHCTLGLASSIFQKKCKEYIKNFWNWLNWGSALGGLVIVLMWLLFIQDLYVVQEKSMDVVLKRPSLTSGTGFDFATNAQRDMYATATEDLHAEVAKLSSYLETFRLFLSWYTIMIMCRFFQAFLAQPKLAVVTNTVLLSLPDMAHFMIVLMLVFLAYSVAGMFLFGHRLLAFSEVSFAIMSCFLIMLGDFDYAELSNEHLVTAACWFLSFQVLVALIMLNMLLAIIMDIYSEVKANAQDEKPLWTQFYDTFRDMYEKREWLNLKIVEESLERLEIDDEDRINKDDLLRQVPGMPEAQAEDLVNYADKMEENEQNKGLKISDAMKVVGEMKITVRKIWNRIVEIQTLEREEKSMLIARGNLTASGGLGEASRKGAKNLNVKLDPSSEQKLGALDARLAQMEEFLNESMCFTVHRGKEMRNRLTIIEDLLKSEQHYNNNGHHSNRPPLMLTNNGNGSSSYPMGTGI